MKLGGHHLSYFSTNQHCVPVYVFPEDRAFLSSPILYCTKAQVYSQVRSVESSTSITIDDDDNKDNMVASIDDNWSNEKMTIVMTESITLKCIQRRLRRF